MRFSHLAYGLLALALTTPALAATAPRVSITSLSELNVPDRPFNEAANANHDVDAAFARAKRSGKEVMIDLGGNWCADCRIMAGLMELPELDAFLHAHYEMVSVDVGRFNRNLQIPARFGITERLEGVPALLIATPDGKLVNGTDVFATASASEMTPRSVADY